MTTTKISLKGLERYNIKLCDKCKEINFLPMSVNLEELKYFLASKLAELEKKRIPWVCPVNGSDYLVKWSDIEEVFYEK